MGGINRFEEIEAWKTYALAEICARQIAKFIAYLEANPRKRRRSDQSENYEA